MRILKTDGNFKTVGNASHSEAFYTGKYAAQVNGSSAAENSVYTTVSGLTVGAQYQISGYVNATTKTTAYLFAREVGGKNYTCTTVSDPTLYVLRTHIFTATAEIMEIGLSVAAGTSEFKYACVDEISLIRVVEEKVASVTVSGDTLKEIKISGNAKAETGREVYLKVYFTNTASATLDVAMTWNGEEYATIPFYKTGTVNANAVDATYIPVVLKGDETVVTLNVTNPALTIKSVEVVTINDRW